MEKHDLDESRFVREKMFDEGQSQLKKYAAFVIGKYRFFSLLKYELITSLLGPLPGALGLFLRKKFYPLLFKKIGQGVVFGRGVTIRHADKISLGDRVIIDDYAFIDGRGSGEEGLSIGKESIVGRYAVILSKVGGISIGSHCNIGAFTNIVAQGGVQIEDWVQIAGGCKISGGLFKFHLTEKDEVGFSRYTKGKIVIQERSYLGGNTLVMDGVTIGRGCMTGAGSVVMQNIPEFSIYMPKPGMILGKTISKTDEETLSNGKTELS